MAEVKWIKIVTGIFDDEKIQLIEQMPDSDTVLVIWFKLLCLAGKTNNHGIIMLSDKIPYTDEMLATIFRRPLNTVRLALTTFEAYGMIEIVDGVVTITNWEKHQNDAKLESIREYNRLAKQKERKRKKLLLGQGNVVDSHDTDIEVDVDKEVDIDNKENIGAKSKDSPPTEPPVIELILNNKSMFPIQQQKINEWKLLYPAVDIMQELRKMKGWLDANPTKRKTKSGIMRFVNSWLAREQDRGGNNGGFTNNSRNNGARSTGDKKETPKYGHVV